MADQNNASKKTRVLVVDDSALIRRMVTDIINSDPRMEVVGQAPNGKEGLRLVHELSPQVVTLDVDMPVQDGFTTLKKIMEEKPTAVIMLSGLTQAGAQLTLKCLEAGAVDFVPKPLGIAQRDLSVIADDILRKVRAAVLAQVFRSIHRHTGVGEALPKEGKRTKDVNEDQLASVPAVEFRGRPESKLIVIGISTGGPAALREVFPYFPKNSPPILLTQHMPKTFTKAFAERLDRMSKITVKEAEEGDPILPGQALVAPGDFHLTVKKVGPSLKASLSKDPPQNGHRPSADVMFASALEACGGGKLVAAVMTGMGRDGATGLKAIRDAGGRTVGQDKETCVVYGMPKSAFDEGAVEEVAPLDKITEAILKAAQKD